MKNIKRGALPVKQLKDAINNAINPTRNSALEKVRDLWEETKADEAKVDVENGVDTGRSDAERAAKETPTPTSAIDKDKNLDDEIRKVTNQFLKEADDQKKAQWHAKFKSQPFTILEDDWKGPEFIETNHLGGAVLCSNTTFVMCSSLKSARSNKCSPRTNPSSNILVAWLRSWIYSSSRIPKPSRCSIRR